MICMRVTSRPVCRRRWGRESVCGADRGLGYGDNARVENVVSVSEDGSRVYFVAQGVLADNLGVG